MDSSQRTNELPTQRAVLYDRVGGPEVLEIRDVAVPKPPAAGRIVVDVTAVGLNPYDAKVRSGAMPSDTPFPRGICGDVAGVVIAVGASDGDADGDTEAGDATLWDGSPIAIGDRVFGWGLNTLRQCVTMRASSVARIPDDVDAVFAGSLATPGLTALSCLDAVTVEPGATVMVSAASGSVGFLIAQLLVQRGVTVIGTAGERNHDRLRAAGIIPVTYGDGLEDRVRSALALTGATLDAAFDQGGAETIGAALALGVTPERICTIADYAAATEHGLRTPAGTRSAARLDELAGMLSAGTLVLPVEQTFDLEHVRDAFALLEGGHSGKVVVEP